MIDRTRTRTRKDPEDRKAQIIDAALIVAKEVGYEKVTRDRVAAQANVSTGCISLHFSPIDLLKNAVMKHAVKREVVEVVAQGLANRHPAAMKAPQKLKERAVKQLTA